MESEKKINERINKMEEMIKRARKTEDLMDYQSLLSRPKPDTQICDHDRHANIKPKPDINKNHLTFSKLLPKAFLFFSILVSLLKLYNL